MELFLMGVKYLIILNKKLNMEISNRYAIRIIHHSIINKQTIMKNNLMAIINN